jgi:hypothetical protein
LTGLAVVVSVAGLMIFRKQGTLEERTSFGLSTVVRTGYNLTGRAGPLSVLIVVALVAGLLTLWKRRHESPDGAVVALTMLVPLVLAMVLSVSRPMFTANYLLDVTPMVACIAAVELAALVADHRARIGVVAVAVLLGLLGQVAVFHTPDREQPDSATRVVLRLAGPADQITFESADAVLPFQHYLDSRDLTGPGIAGLQVGGDPLEPAPTGHLGEAAAALPDGASLWLVVAREEPKELARDQHALAAAGLTQTDDWSFSNVGLQRWQRSS